MGSDNKDWVNSRSSCDLSFQLIEINAGSKQKITFPTFLNEPSGKSDRNPAGLIHFGLLEQVC